MRNVKDYGAKGDGKTLDTEAFQRAIDYGGMVYVPPGVYITGTLYLKSDGGLYLESGSVIKGSHFRNAYNPDDFCPQNVVSATEFVTGAHLITAVEQKNIVIEGHGTIDGQGDYWMNRDNANEYGDYIPNKERPAQMIFICECENVRICGVNIINGPYWHLFFHGCDNVFVRNVSIKGDRPRWTNDGIDIDCCSNVTVSDCIIDTGDDAIALRGNYTPLQKEKICENITISNCIIHAERDYGIRIGVGKGLIRNCTISNMVIEAPNWGGIGILGRWSDFSLMASSAENILFSNISIHAKYPVEIRAAYGESPLPNSCYIQNIRMDNLFLVPTKANIIKGFGKDCPVGYISLSNITVDLHALSGADGKAAFSVQDADNVSFNNLTVLNTGSNYNGAIDAVNCKNITSGTPNLQESAY